MPNHIGAFLKASKCFSTLGINISRVSYNKAVDSHTLFLDAEGTQEQLEKADAELILIDYADHIAITGDVYINTHGLTAEQAEYNQYAPILMTSVDTDPKLSVEERKAILQRLGVGQWRIFGAHGFKKDYSVSL